MTDEDASPKPNQPEPREPAAVEEFFPDEHRRSVPKIAWWILGIACVALLAFLLVRPEWFTRSADDDSLHVPADRHFTKTLASLDHPDGLWLNDDASSTSFTVKLPVDSKRSDTRIRLTGTTQVANDSTVFLTVSVDGTQVYRSELPRGDNPLNTLVGIPADAAADGSVRIVVRTDGSLHNQTCATDRSPGANVHLDDDPRRGRPRRTGTHRARRRRVLGSRPHRGARQHRKRMAHRRSTIGTRAHSRRSPGDVRRRGTGGPGAQHRARRPGVDASHRHRLVGFRIRTDRGRHHRRHPRARPGELVGTSRGAVPEQSYPDDRGLRSQRSARGARRRTHRQRNIPT